MSWAKLDDGMWSHPKFLDLSNGAIGVWSKGLSWCAQHLSDGAIPRTLKTFFRATDGEVAELMRAGLWEETATGWQVHDYLEFNPSRESVLGDRAKGKQRAQRSYERRKERADSSGEETKFFAEEGSTLFSDPSRPVPTHSEKEEKKLAACVSSETAGGRAREARFEKPPVGEAPPDHAPPEPARIPWLAVWKTAERMRGFYEGQLGHPGREEQACRSIADAITASVGGSAGADWQEALERLVGAWLADKWVAENKPPLSNLAGRMPKYARAKSVVKIVRPTISDEEWMKQLEAESKAELRRQREAAGGGAS